MNKWIERIAIVLFCLLIALPFGMTLLGIQSVSSENRTKAEAPSFAETGMEFSSAFEAYYNDTFPLRAQLVRLNSTLSLKLLHTAPGSQVIAGRDGFLFFHETVPDYTDTHDVSDEYLSDLSAQLKKLQDTLAEQGTAFVLAVAPNKNSIYPEAMPSTYQQGASSVYDRLMTRLKADGVYAADLKTALLAAKEKGLVYHKLDTHWNDRGALAAYRAIAQTAMAQDPSLQLDLFGDLVFIEKPFTGDLASTMLGLEGTEGAPTHMLTGFKADSDDYYAPKLTTTSSQSANIVVYRDSFGTALVPFIAQASGSAFFTRALPYDFSAAKGADVVVLEIAERNVATMLEEITLPVFGPEDEYTAEEPADEPAETPPEEEHREPGWDIPTPEPFNKEELPDDLDDVKSNSDEWDDYDPFSEPPGALLQQPDAPAETEDTAPYRLLVSAGSTTATVTLHDVSPASAALTLRADGASLTHTFPYENGGFTLSGLTADTRYAARVAFDGETVDFFVQTQPADSAAADLAAEFTPQGVRLVWTGEPGATYRIYRSSFAEGERALAAEVTQTDVLLPFADTLQANYRICKVSGGEESGMSAPATLMRPVYDLPVSDKDFEQSYLPLVSREDQIIYVMARNVDGKYGIPVNAVLTSTGESETRTPIGAFEFYRKREWVTWIQHEPGAVDEEGNRLYSQYSHYNLDFNGNLKTHSVIFNAKNHDTPLFNMREHLGRPVSGGCLRLTVTDAKWLYDHFEVGDYIEIVDGVKHPTLKQELKDTLPEL